MAAARGFAAGSLEYQTLLRWIAQGLDARPGRRSATGRSEVTPTEEFLVAPAARRADPRHGRLLRRLAIAMSRAGPCMPFPTRLPRSASTARSQGERDGETTVLVRYLERPDRLCNWRSCPRGPTSAGSRRRRNNYIDEHVLAKLRKLRMNPSPLADDTVFLAPRVCRSGGHGAHGSTRPEHLPPITIPDKRARLIDRLLERPEFADFWALKWSDLLRNEEKTLDRKGVQAFHHWIRQSIAEGKPLDRFAYELVSARGSTYSRPAANYYRANRDPMSRGEATAQVFLGLRLQCAKCHNHPFDRWTQADYYDWAGFFARVRYKIIEIRRDDELDKHEFDGEQVVWMSSQSRVRESSRPADRPSRACWDSPSRRSPPATIRWKCWPAGSRTGSNPFFARVQVNRIWYHLLGRGIVDPVDDFRATNLPVNEPLLAALAADFVEHDFDLRHLVRTIAKSQHLSIVERSRPRPTPPTRSNFSHALRPAAAGRGAARCLAPASRMCRPASPAIPQACGPCELPGVQVPRVGVEERRSGGEEQFLVKFGKPQRLLTCECERSEEPTLGQAFQLISGPTINALLAEPENRLDQLANSSRSSGQIIDELYCDALAAGRAGKSSKPCWPTSSTLPIAARRWKTCSGRWSIARNSLLRH